MKNPKDILQKIHDLVFSADEDKVELSEEVKEEVVNDAKEAATEETEEVTEEQVELSTEDEVSEEVKEEVVELAEEVAEETVEETTPEPSYVKTEDFEAFKTEILESIKQIVSPKQEAEEMKTELSAEVEEEEIVHSPEALVETKRQVRFSTNRTETVKDRVFRRLWS